MHVPEPPQPLEKFGRIEARGIDQVPDAERHGTASELFAVWAASNTTYLYILLGGALIGLGLNVWQGFCVVLAGNAFWLLVGLLSISGPASGTPSSIVMRAMFGVLGNRLNVAFTGCAVSIAYEAINLCIAALAGFALLATFGIHPNLPEKLCIVALIAAITLTISVYGHATIVRLSGFLAASLAISVAVLAAYLAPHVNFAYVPHAAPHGGALWAAAMAGVTVIASGPLSWGTAADYARYLPQNTSGLKIIGFTVLGGFIPSILLGGLGVLAGTAVDMADPQNAFGAILPAWFYPIFLLVIITGTTANNVLTAYSSGLSLQSLGIEASRSVTVLFDGFAGVSLAIYALFVSDFIDTLNNILALSVSLLGPSLAIYGLDIFLRGNCYDGAELHDETRKSAFWYWHGFNWVGLAALGAGGTASLLCANTKFFVGPIAKLLDGADVSTLVGPAVAALVYGGTACYNSRHLSGQQNPPFFRTETEKNA